MTKPRFIWVKKEDGFTQIWGEKSLNLLQAEDRELIKNSYHPYVDFNSCQELQGKLKVAEVALEFYGNSSAWVGRTHSFLDCTLARNDSEMTGTSGLYFGGKTAREALAKLRGEV